MIGMFLETSLFPRKLFEMTSGRSGSTLLETLPERVHAFAVALNSLTTKGLPFGVSSHMDNAQIDTEDPALGIVGIRCGDVECHRKEEGSMAVDQISLSLDRSHTGLLIAAHAEGNQDSPGKRQEGDLIEILEGHHTRIIDNSAFWAKRGFDAFVSLVGFRRFADATDRQLSRKLVRGPQLPIGQLLQGKLVGRLLIKGDLRHIVGCLIEGVHGLKQGLMLVLGWSKLQKHRLFHRSSLPSLVKVVNGLWGPGAQAPNKERPFLPGMNARGILGGFR